MVSETVQERILCLSLGGNGGRNRLEHSDYFELSIQTNRRLKNTRGYFFDAGNRRSDANRALVVAVLLDRHITQILNPVIEAVMVYMIDSPTRPFAIVEHPDEAMRRVGFPIDGGLRIAVECDGNRLRTFWSPRTVHKPNETPGVAVVGEQLSEPCLSQHDAAPNTKDTFEHAGLAAWRVLKDANKKRREYRAELLGRVRTEQVKVRGEASPTKGKRRL